MSIGTYAEWCNDAWLNTEGDDISAHALEYKDHQEVVAALEAKCAALAAENAGIKSAIQNHGILQEDDNDNMDDVSLGRLQVQSCNRTDERQIPETPTTDAFWLKSGRRGGCCYRSCKKSGGPRIWYKDFKAAQGDLLYALFVSDTVGKG